MKLLKMAIVGLAFGGLLTGCNNQATELHIAAAASLADVMEDIENRYEEKNDIELVFNFAGSGKLAQQIEQGAPVDVFISANEQWMDKLEESQYIDTSTKEIIAENQLVLIAREDTALQYSTFRDIDKKDIDHIAIGMPESVPAGEYTKETLEELDKWDRLQDAFVFAKDVRQVLTYVETGNADIGFVYLSDAMTSEKVTVLAKSDASQHKPIVYPGAITANSESKSEAEQFLTFLQSEKAQKIFKEYGFVSK